MVLYGIVNKHRRKKMGFDLYGLNPKLTREQPTINWEDKPTEKEKDIFFKDIANFEKENVGYYFRNNVWHWRPLADYILELMEDDFTEEEKRSWHCNEGFEVIEEVAIEIANRLEKELKTSRVKEIEKSYDERMRKAEKKNKRVKEKIKYLEKLVAKQTGKNDLVPRDYPEPFHTTWNFFQKQHDYDASYPFSEQNVIEFMKFCRESGGFKIC
jgi:hypothetical protein